MLMTHQRLLSEQISDPDGIINIDSSEFVKIGCDATFGSDSSFLDGLPEDIYYFAHILSASQVFTRKPKIGLPEYAV